MRKNWMKQVSFLVIAGLFFLLAACGSNEASGDDSSGTVKLKVLDWNSSNTQEVQKAIQEAVKAEVPNVELEFENINWEKDFNSIMQTRIAAQQLPDIMLVKGGDHPKYADHFMDLTNESFIQDIPEDIRKDLPISGKDYAVPYTANYQGVFYNKKIFADNNLEVPKTWDELMKTAKVLESKGVTPFTAHFKDYQLGNNLNQFASIEVFAKDPEWGNKLQKDEVSFAKSKEFKSIFEHFNDIYQYAGDDPFGVDFTGAAEKFANGETAMWIIGTWSVDQTLKNNPDLELGFFPLPANNEEDTKLIMQTDYTWTASANTQHPEEVKKVLEILATNKDLSKTYIDNVQTQSLIPDVIAEGDKPYLTDIENVKANGVVEANIGNVQIPWPYQEQVANYIAEYLLGQKTVGDALKASDEYKANVKFGSE
ncbi:extracellular solute-binding protein [Domibacillus sp. DTU_2020_1001157_1_SI_ALB_TIR_016]|uniref:ABC transporter substrate-binding protein n=1 Tax=Domibacillus sp. DTU_2020_1001157_1_SI_ALB_TIR_016 TaxID=3077789 RepID=UPI0028E6BD48|nr:extracellular solute-binding protein [Domibacillus sp. DTU_2020_1001157_1_SI_ALB_TIR_016]WNS78767.1 extracellular solute-binding protein [Domibacillus sp. DTU_2020_1001157_1_SI_ALB_TIR_016]